MLSIKFRFEDQIRRISVKPSISYDELANTVRMLFDLDACVVKYADEDGDMITIQSEMDLAEAVSQLASRCLVLHVSRGATRAAAPPSPAAARPAPAAAPSAASSATPERPANAGPDFEKIANEVKDRIAEALAAFAPATKPAPAAPPSATDEMSALLQQALAFFGQAQTAPQNGLDALARQIESATLLARVVSFLHDAKNKCAGELPRIVKQIEECVDVPAIVERIEEEADRNPQVEKVLDAFREAFGEESTVAHDAVCDHCDSAIVGVRYKCSVCVDYDLCQSCEKREVHTHHAFIKIEHPTVTWKVAPVPHHAQFVRDATLPDGAEVAHDDARAIEKTWVVRNSGSERWQEGCYLELTDSSVPDGARYAFPQRVNVAAVIAGFEGDVTALFPAAATAAPGQYRAYYRMCRADGTVFGPRLWAHFAVAAPFAAEVATLAELGFTDRGACEAALGVAKGDVQRAVLLLLGERA